ncbi:MAG TPA: helicase-related protein, partial [Spirochaetales bacterium]|nr:helicase-related protein [Spirochaetales bacterium]
SFLVSTSIVEVGVDVPNATCMVIEHAERFGLAALHQLRGRIGRGNDESYCFLVWSEPLTEEAKKRLTVMKNTTDGFVIAEEDLAIRGPGDITGTAQSGLLQFNFADPIHNTRLLEWAREDASELLAGDPELTGKAGSLVKTVLAKANPFIESLTARA